MTTTVPYDLESLQRAFQKGERLRFVFFWSHTKTVRGVVGKECLSQWYPAPFRLDGRQFPTAEHYMMFQKATLFGDNDVAQRALVAPSPGAAKALGRSVRGFVESVWEDRRLAIVAAGNEAKFRAHPELRAFLIGTGSRVLVEASPTDRIWGIGIAEDDTRAKNPTLWRGLNLLGFALMIARGRLVEDGG